MVKVGEKGQIVIPAKARKIFDIKPGDVLMVLGDEEQGIALLKGLSTTCFSLGLEDGMALVESLDATEAIFITDDYEVHTSSGMGTVIPYEIRED